MLSKKDKYKEENLEITLTPKECAALTYLVTKTTSALAKKTEIEGRQRKLTDEENVTYLMMLWADEAFAKIAQRAHGVDRAAAMTDMQNAAKPS